jgi:hypothetical protein
MVIKSKEQWHHVITSHSASSMPRSRVLIFSATKLYRHESIPTATEALKSHGDSIDVHFDASEDNAVFSDAGLAQYDAVLFLSTSGDGACARQPISNQ